MPKSFEQTSDTSDTLENPGDIPGSEFNNLKKAQEELKTEEKTSPAEATNENLDRREELLKREEALLARREELLKREEALLARRDELITERKAVETASEE